MSIESVNGAFSEEKQRIIGEDSICCIQMLFSDPRIDSFSRLTRDVTNIRERDISHMYKIILFVVLQIALAWSCTLNIVSNYD